MKMLFIILALLGLGLTIVPPAIHLFGELELLLTFKLMFVGMVLWYVGATPWLGRKDLKPSDTEVQI